MKKYPYKISAICSERLAFPFYFISDIHLSTYSGIEQDKRLKYIMILLEEIRESKGTLFILGDFFDFWFDKNNYVPSKLKPVIELLSKIIKEGIEIHYIAGNHDYWIKGYLTKEIGIRFYKDALDLDYCNKKIFLQHGDGIVFESKIYPVARKVMRSCVAIAILKILPVKWIYKLGEKISHYNNEHDEIPMVYDSYVSQMSKFLLSKNSEAYDLAISGHVHYPLEEENEGKKAVILGDWINHWTYGVMDESGFELKKMSH